MHVYIIMKIFLIKNDYFTIPGFVLNQGEPEKNEKFGGGILIIKLKGFSGKRPKDS